MSTRTDLDLVAVARTGSVHFMGIAGAGMSALAEMIARSGGNVSGCDTNVDTDTLRALRGLGVELTAGHSADHARNADAIVATSAVPATHPELEAARARGIPVLKRAEALGSIVNRGTVVALAGTHGKTTTTAMTTLLLSHAGLDPTGFVGGVVPAWGSGLHVGSDRLFVVEADEYDRSFLQLRPTIAVVTAIEADHLEIYGSIDGLQEGFEEFLRPLPPTGCIAVCADDKRAAMLTEKPRSARTVSYGTSEHAMLRAVNITASGESMHFKVTSAGQELGEMSLQVPGLHNVRNALGAFAAARHLGVNFETAAEALAQFEGVSRRFEVLGAARDIVIVDDYAHHPTEVEATIAAARRAYPERRLVVAFQPHLFSRTRDLAPEFGRALSAADLIFIADVYPAREQPIPGVTGVLVADATRLANAAIVHYEVDVSAMGDALLAAARAGDVCVFMGAGDIDRVARAVMARLVEGA